MNKNPYCIPPRRLFFREKEIYNRNQEEDSVVSFQIDRDDTTTSENEFVFHSLKIRCRGFYKDVVALSASAEPKIALRVGGFIICKTSWALSCMIEKQFKQQYGWRASEIYIEMRKLGFVNSVANTIVSFCILMEDRQKLLHYSRVPPQFKEIANEFRSDYVINLHLGIDQFSKPAFQAVTMLVTLPKNIDIHCISVVKSRECYISAQIECKNDQFLFQNITPSKKGSRIWKIPVTNDFSGEGKGFLLMLNHFKNWNADTFEFSYSMWKMPMYCKKIISKGAAWFLLTFQETASFQEFLNNTNSPFDMSRIEGTEICISNSKGQDVVGIEHCDAFLFWHRMDRYRHCGGMACNVEFSYDDGKTLMGYV